ncbi:antitoxin protein of toxin-antitoxin system [Actinomadura pelletieri DSM 43383]|uniref:Antitoxin protein of toxin-antitoxin system n=1 Tax=Actinomadura pelletieri DSM 43383 TaxID=1120940 RepID=A0A495QPK4_9ACTN|nr:antitoxin [Actinomadura pelletieri]RKS74871.1 antitoxin protein of toxin-antitoxin system [Actinomadura pelletieri DSM 43383]
MSIVDKVKQMLGQHPDKAKHGVDKAGDKFDERTGGKYSDKVDKAQNKAGDYIDREGGGQTGGMGDQPGGMGDRPGGMGGGSAHGDEPGGGHQL